MPRKPRLVSDVIKIDPDKILVGRSSNGQEGGQGLASHGDVESGMVQEAVGAVQGQ